MIIAAWIIAGLGVISAVLGTLSIIQVPSDPIFTYKLTWQYWMALAIVLVLLSITCFLGRRQDID
ncbi:MAG: hypothetical protein WC370_07295 [Dehalococcoidales bacterium]|jgi:low affinity Fe/Cu permease